MIGGMIAGALTLVALQVFGSSKGADRGGALLKWIAGGVDQLLSADKAAIPNLSGGKTAAKPPSSSGGGAAPGHGSVGGPLVPAAMPTNPPLTQL